MRPLKIELEGFSTFAHSTTVEFDEIDLVAFVGPTGSGKSTLIDAMTFALYGSVARYGDVRLVAPVIHQGSSEARVRLDFELANRRFTAVRVVRRTKTGASTKEARLEEADGEQLVVASGAKEVTKAVEALLGLDFAQFTRTVVLPQGEFAKFLRDEPADRQELLSRLLDFGVYSRMGSVAREQAKTAGQQADILQLQVERKADITKAALAEATAHRARLQTFAEAAEVKLAALTASEAALVDLRDKVGALDRSSEALSTISVPVEVADLTAKMASADEQLATATAQLGEARGVRDLADAGLADAGDPAELASKLALTQRVETLQAGLEALTSAQAEAATATTEASARLAQAKSGADSARSDADSARTAADAGQWLATLAAGEPCPVCRQVVAEVPDHDPSAELTVALASEKQATATEREAQADHAAKAAESEQLARRLSEAKTELADLAERVDPAATPEALEAATAAQAGAKQAAATVKEAERGAEVATERRRRLDTAEQQATRVYGQQRDAVSQLAPPAPQGVSLLEDFAALAEWADDQKLKLVEARTEIADAGKREAATKATLLEELATAGEAFSLTPSGDLANEITNKRSAAEVEIARLTDGLADKAELEQQVKTLIEERQVKGQLGQLLNATGFERWLLTEALGDLVERATVRLFELSSGQFSLAATDNSFEIIDHNNADQRRDVRTLSGGETFLASLALALALSDSIAELAPVDAPRLGSMFLDEGFGTLDPETLDLVATAIEELSAEGRMVGIVTHIEALAERMPVRFVVQKTPATSTVTRVTA